ncbi:MAG: hypothetical protein ACJ74W_23100 [Pyrinomonadaceae bacterium]
MGEHDPRLERLYDLLPVIYRQRDVEAGQPLRALLQVIAEQVNVVEDDIAQLYENWFIETCEDWVVPYIADLIGYRAIHEAGALGGTQTAARNRILVPRREVANTIRYRRRKGTLALLELLARDVAGWPARAVEFYQQLLAAQHVSHLQLERARTLDLRRGDALDRLTGPFDEFAHAAAVRRLNSHHAPGRHNINNAGIFVWRLRAYKVTRAPAYCIDSARHRYTFSMLGNDTPLFTKAVEEPDPTHVADEMNVPAPIRRRGLDERPADYYGRSKSFYIWRDGTSRPVPLARIVAADLSKWAYRPQGRELVVDPRLGRIVFSPRIAPQSGVWVSYHYGFSADIGGGEYERHLRPLTAARLRRPADFAASPPDAPPDPAERHLYLVSQQQTSTYYFDTIGRALEAWQRDMPAEAVIQIEDSGAYVEQFEIRLGMSQHLEIRAANGTRPYLRLLNWYTNRPDSLSLYGPQETPPAPPHDEDLLPEEVPARRRGHRAGANEQAAAPRQPQAAAQPGYACTARPPRLTLDGLLIAGRSMMIAGNLSDVLIRHCTLVPGWSLDEQNNPSSGTEPSIELTDTSTRLRIEHSIVGSILINVSEVASEPLEVHISDSVLDATGNDLEALYGPDNAFAQARLRILRSTVFGRVRTHAITLAENCIFMGRVGVARSQLGCMRFCYVPPDSRTPRRYNCQPDLVVSGLSGADARAQAEMRVRPQFNSVRYGTPDYCQLADTCPLEISRGADDESEMGVFHDLFQPQREANLRARLDDFTPAGMNAGIIFAT